MKKHFWKIVLAGIVAIITAVGTIINNNNEHNPKLSTKDSSIVNNLKVIAPDTNQLEQNKLQ